MYGLFRRTLIYLILQKFLENKNSEIITENI